MSFLSRSRAPRPSGDGTDARRWRSLHQGRNIPCLFTWTLTGALAVAATAVVVDRSTGTHPGEAPPAGAASAPVHTSVHAVALPVAAPDRNAVALPARRTSPFSMVGVTWADSRAVLDGTVQVRTRFLATGNWSDWRPVLQDDEATDSADARTRGGTEPLWVGVSDGIEVQVNGRVAHTLPAGLRVDLVDPGHVTTAVPAAYQLPQSAGDTAAVDTAAGTDPATDTPVTTTSADPGSTTSTTAVSEPAEPTVTTDGVPPTTSTTAASGTTAATGTTSTIGGAGATTTTTTRTTSTTGTTPATSTTYPTTTTSSRPPAPVSPEPRPLMVSRAGWGADESIRDQADPNYGEAVRVVFVHHTDTGNDYACSDSASIVRGIYAYHVQSEGWADIGYNFLVDKCGTLFEGRHGGVDLPVIGAQTYGFNTNSTGIAVLGTYTTTKASAAALTTVARVAAWKLLAHGMDPAGSSTLLEGASDSVGFTLGTTYPFRTISGHRDGRATECPGDALYTQLPTIRSLAGWPQAVTLRSVTGAGSAGGVSYTRGAVTVSWMPSGPSPLLRRFDLLVDGQVTASAPMTARSAPLTVTPGRHSVAVRAIHWSGHTARSAAATVVGDTIPPTFPSGPAPSLRGGTVTTTAVPVTLTWRAADNASLARVLATAPTSATFASGTGSWGTSIAPGAARTFGLTAVDTAGNSGTASRTATVTITQETAATRAGSWSTRTNSQYLGGASLSSSAPNASLTWNFTGRAVAWVVSRASSSGQAVIYLDGAKVGTVDLRSSSTAYRQAIWTRSGLSPVHHTLRVVVAGTSGRPTVTTDGVVVLS